MRVQTAMGRHKLTGPLTDDALRPAPFATGPRQRRPAKFPRVFIGRVVGRVVSTVKQDTLSAVTLQWVQPVTSRGEPVGKPLVAVDTIGVGPGETIYYITSREAALTLREPFAAVDAGIVGKVDCFDIDGTECRPD